MLVSRVTTEPPGSVDLSFPQTKQGQWADCNMKMRWWTELWDTQWAIWNVLVCLPSDKHHLSDIVSKTQIKLTIHRQDRVIMRVSTWPARDCPACLCTLRMIRLGTKARRLGGGCVVEPGTMLDKCSDSTSRASYLVPNMEKCSTLASDPVYIVIIISQILCIFPLFK